MLDKERDFYGPIVFLDVDGVLNHFIGMEEEWKNQGMFALSPLAMDQLGNLYSQIKPKLTILSSTWRYLKEGFLPMQRLRTELRYRGIEIHGKTPRLKDNSASRGIEIAAWLRNNEINTRNLLIIDDDADLLRWQHNYFLQVDPATGFNNSYINRALEIVDSSNPRFGGHDYTISDHCIYCGAEQFESPGFYNFCGEEQ